MSNRKMLRETAKKIYKEQIKAQNIPKSRRIPFSQFFKQFLKQQQSLKDSVVEETQVAEDNEDFDFENMVNVNEITDDDVESEEEENS